MKKKMLNLGAIFLIAAILLGMAIPAILEHTGGTPSALIQDIDHLRGRLISQAEENRKYCTAYSFLGLLAGAGLAFLGTGICLKVPNRENVHMDTSKANTSE